LDDLAVAVRHVWRSSDRVPLFCDAALAARIERADATLMAKAVDAARRRSAAGAFVKHIAGGLATFAELGSPFNKVVGVGFGGVPSTAALDDVEHAFQAVGAPVQIELANLADPAIGAALSDRGYRLTSFENVLGRRIDGARERVSAPGIHIRPSGDEELAAWLAVVVDGFAHPDEEGVPAHEDFSPDAVEARLRRRRCGSVRRAT
jgi:hypothetical protein